RARVRHDPLAGFRQGRAGKRHCRICQTGTPFRRSGRENRIVTEREAAPAAAPDSRNLVMRIAVAAVLIPLAVAIAYAGGWLWTALVTLAAIGLFVEWLASVCLAQAIRVTVPGVAALAVAGLCFAVGRPHAPVIVVGGGFGGVG